MIQARPWRRISFSAKLALIILLTGLAIAVIPLGLARNEAQRQAQGRAADKAGLAGNLIAGERRSLGGFAQAVAQQVGPPAKVASARGELLRALERDSAANGASDIIGLTDMSGDLFVRGGRPFADSATLALLTAAARVHLDSVEGPPGQTWLVATARNGDTLAVVARPLDGAALSMLRHSVVTSGDPADVAVVRDGRFTTAGSVAGSSVGAGETVEASVQALVQSGGASVITLRGHDAAVAVASLGGTLSLVVSTPVGGLTTFWEPALLLIAVILVAMLFILVFVQTDLQRPLSRLDRAIAALGRGDLDVAIPSAGDSEIGRLGRSFEMMRREMRATIHSNAARAAIAFELNAPQPLETALRRVTADLRHSTGAGAGLIVVRSTEMGDAFAVAVGMTASTIDADHMLGADGPLGTVFRQEGTRAAQLCAAANSPEASLGLGQFCAAPLRLGRETLGVLAITDRDDGFLPAQRDLVESAAEQVALALERYRFLAMVQRQASIDDLTGLHNHRFLVEYLRQQIALAERQGTPLAILMCDLDHFKTLNDSFGHHVGDQALRGFAEVLLACVRRSDLAARYGGEEFVVVMANTGPKEARLVAEKIRATVATAPIAVEERKQPIRITVSIGGAAYPQDTTSAGELLLIADRALYAAKGAGRNRVWMADPDMVALTELEIHGSGPERRQQDAIVASG